MSLDETRKRLEIAEGRRPDAKPVGCVRLAVTDDEEAKLPLRRLDRVVGFARRWLDQPGHPADDRPLGQAVEGLADDPNRLPELLHANEVAVVGVAGRANRHLEVEFLVSRV